MSRIRSAMRQSPAIVISLIALTFSLGGGAGYAASVAGAARPAVTKITWHTLGLKNHWLPLKGAGGGAPAYTVSNGIVYLTGICHRTNQALPLGTAIAVLPKGARPKHNIWLEAFNYSATGGTTIEVQSSGAIIIVGSGGDENFWTSLAGIEFPLGS